MRTALLTLLCLTASSAVFAGELNIPSPPFTIMQKGAPPIQLSQLKGKITVLTFIHTTCPHCQALTMGMNGVARDYMPKGVQFIECAFNENAENLVAQFVQTFHPTFPVGYSNLPTVKAYLDFSSMDKKMFYVPHMVFLDAKGNIRGDYAGESEFMKNPEANVRMELDKMLAAPAPAPATAASKTKKK